MIRMFGLALLTAVAGVAATLWMGRGGLEQLRERRLPAVERVRELRELVVSQRAESVPPEPGAESVPPEPGAEVGSAATEVEVAPAPPRPEPGVVEVAKPELEKETDTMVARRPLREEPAAGSTAAAPDAGPSEADAPAGAADDARQTREPIPAGPQRADAERSARLVRRMLALYRTVSE